VKHRLIVEPAEAGQRLDQLLAARLPDLSRSRLKTLIEQGHVKLAGALAKASARPRAGAELLLEVPEAQPTELVAEELQLPVLFEDAHLLVIDKPAGVAVHPGAGIASGTVVHGLLHQVKDLLGIGGELRPGIVHRLDKDTSGCLAVAKTEAALRGLQAAFKAREVDKRYRAIVHGAPAEEGELDTLHARHPTDRKRFSTRVREGKRAVTRWRVLERFEGAALVDVELMTGRTHQIRAHFADAGFPLLGDKLYGGTKREARLPEAAPLRRAAQALGRQALHAALLSFEHPITAARVSCEAPLPPDFLAALAELR
jgi:23S rRNA pseudouridine1911/1915/1917 synthase